MRRNRIFAGGALLAALGVALVAACFSERAAPTAPSFSNVQCTLPLGPDVPGSVVITIRGFAFQPAQVHIRAGTTVTWVNCSVPEESAHTTTSDTGVWNSPLLASGEAFSFTFAQPGQFPYHCEPHPFMTGTVIVE